MPAIGGTNALEPVASTKRRAWMRVSPASTVRSSTNFAQLLQDRDAEAFEALDRIVRRDRGDGLLDMRLDPREVDARRREFHAKAGGVRDAASPLSPRRAAPSTARNRSSGNPRPSRRLRSAPSRRQAAPRRRPPTGRRSRRRSRRCRASAGASSSFEAWRRRMNLTAIGTAASTARPTSAPLTCGVIRLSAELGAGLQHAFRSRRRWWRRSRSPG